MAGFYGLAASLCSQAGRLRQTVSHQWGLPWSKAFKMQRKVSQSQYKWWICRHPHHQAELGWKQLEGVFSSPFLTKTLGKMISLPLAFLSFLSLFLNHDPLTNQTSNGLRTSPYKEFPERLILLLVSWAQWRKDFYGTASSLSHAVWDNWEGGSLRKGPDLSKSQAGCELPAQGHSSYWSPLGMLMMSRDPLGLKSGLVHWWNAECKALNSGLFIYF